MSAGFKKEMVFRLPRTGGPDHCGNGYQTGEWTYTWSVARNQYTFVILNSDPDWGYVEKTEEGWRISDIAGGPDLDYSKVTRIPEE